MQRDGVFVIPPQPHLDNTEGEMENAEIIINGEVSTSDVLSSDPLLFEIFCTINVVESYASEKIINYFFHS
jgi:hypothetical protein